MSVVALATGLLTAPPAQSALSTRAHPRLAQPVASHRAAGVAVVAALVDMRSKVTAMSAESNLDEEATAAAMKWVEEAKAAGKKQRQEAEAARLEAEATQEKLSEEAFTAKKRFDQDLKTARKRNQQADPAFVALVETQKAATARLNAEAAEAAKRWSAEVKRVEKAMQHPSWGALR